MKHLFSVNLYKEYSYLKLNELEELPCLGVTIWQRPNCCGLRYITFQVTLFLLQI